MRRSSKKVIIAIMCFSMLLPFITSYNVKAADKSDNSTITEVTPRSIMKSSRTVTFSNGVKITVNYTFQEANNTIIYIDRVYISYFPPHKFSNVRVIGYEILDNYNRNIKVKTYQRPINSSSEVYKEYYILL